jgi:hypothetical protein
VDDEEVKAIEQRGYARGYAAGRKRLRVDVLQERYQREREAFRRRAFLAVLPSAILMQGWTDGEGKSITTRDARVNFAWNVADYAMRRY